MKEPWDHDFPDDGTTWAYDAEERTAPLVIQGFPLVPPLSAYRHANLLLEISETCRASLADGSTTVPHEVWAKIHKVLLELKAQPVAWMRDDGGGPSFAATDEFLDSSWYPLYAASEEVRRILKRLE